MQKFPSSVGATSSEYAAPTGLWIYFGLCFYKDAAPNGAENRHCQNQFGMDEMNVKANNIFWSRSDAWQLASYEVVAGNAPAIFIRPERTTERELSQLAAGGITNDGWENSEFSCLAARSGLGQSALR